MSDRIFRCAILLAFGAVLWMFGAAPAIAHASASGTSLVDREMSAIVLDGRSIEARTTRLAAKVRMDIATLSALSCNCCHGDFGSTGSGHCAAACAAGAGLPSAPSLPPALLAGSAIFGFAVGRLEGSGAAPADKPPRA